MKERPKSRMSETAESPEPPSNTLRRPMAAFRIGWTFFIILLTSLPYLIGWRDTPPGSGYTWILPPYPEDSFAYEAWAQQAARGAILFRDKYTSFPHSPFLFHPFFLISGWISAATGWEIGIVFLLLKAIGVALFFWAFFKYVDYIGLDRLQSVAATLLVGVGSGFGGLLMLAGLGGRLPVVMVDLRLADINTFWSLLWNPLFPYSLTLLVLVMLWLDRGSRSGAKSDWLRAGLATGVLALVHPYSQPLVAACALILAFTRKGAGEAVGLLWRFFLTAGPFLVYLALMEKLDPLVSEHEVQGAMRSPGITSYLYGYGLPLLLAAAGLLRAGQPEMRRWWPLALWFGLSIGLSYLPIWFQRKLVFGSHVPLCILAGCSFGILVNAIRSAAYRRVAIVASLLVGLPIVASSSIYLLATQQAEVSANLGGAYYLNSELLAGLEYLRTHSQADDVVCADLDASRVIPAISGNTVIWGHWAMSIDNAERQKWFAHLFGPRADFGDSRRAADFWGDRIKFVFAEGGLRESMARNPAAWKSILAPAAMVYSNRTVLIFEHR